MQAYRRDIDGLRAVAVVSVVLFHARAPGFGGGFLGVDVFFVISGFLITGILLRNGSMMSIAEFYERRIAPALVAVLAFSACAALWLFSPSELKLFSRELSTAVGFIINIQFMRSLGYFDPAAEESPLLHLWSLSVEEQFYLLYPLFLWLMLRWNRRLLAREPNVTFISVLDTMCPADRCPMITNGQPVLRDRDHLSLPGSLLFGKALWPKISAVLARRAAP